MRKSCFIITLSALTTFVCGQSNFVNAVIVNKGGDSVSGKIDYRDWKYNPETINFIDAANEKKTFGPTSIAGFYLPGLNESYTSLTVEMDMIAGDEYKAINGNFVDSPIIRKTLFLLQLVKNPVIDLYQYSDSYKEHFYCAKENEQPVELIHHYLYNELTKQVLEDQTYRDQLSSIFTDCADVAAASKKMKFRREEIQATVLKYIKCRMPNSVIQVKKEDPLVIKFGIVGGVMWNKFKFKGDNTNLADDNYTGNLSPILGMSMDLGLPRNRNKWHIVNELSFKMYKTGSTFTRPYNNLYTLTSNVDISFSYAQLNTILRFIFQSGSSIKPYINLGVGNAFVIAENENSIHTVYSFGQEENGKAINKPGQYEFSLLGGAGISLRNAQIEFRYTGSKKSFSPFNDLDINVTSFQAMLTYQF